MAEIKREAPFTLVVRHDGLDVDGLPTLLLAARLTVSGATQDAPAPADVAAGQPVEIPFQFPHGLPRGVYDISAVVVNADGESEQIDLALVSKGAVPSRPLEIAIVGGTTMAPVGSRLTVV